MADEYDYESTEDRHLPRKWKEVYDAFRYFGLPAETKEDRDKINDPEFWKPFDKKLKLRVRTSSCLSCPSRLLTDE